MSSLCPLDNIFQSVVPQQAEPAEMDWLGEAAEEAAGQVRAGAHSLLWSGVLYTQRRPTATGDHKVMFHPGTLGLQCESIRQACCSVMLSPFLEKYSSFLDFHSWCGAWVILIDLYWGECWSFVLLWLSVQCLIQRVPLLNSWVFCSVCRYQYYLQLKKDVLEGRITCSLEQAIHLASLAVQGKINLLLFFLIDIIL